MEHNIKIVIEAKLTEEAYQDWLKNCDNDIAKKIQEAKKLEFGDVDEDGITAKAIFIVDGVEY